jgi:26S proteasome regulatory subunit N13
VPDPGYIYLYEEDGKLKTGGFDLTLLTSSEMIRFCWRGRNATMDNPEIDLLMIPTDGHFEPYVYKTSDEPTSKTNGRIFALKFSSSSQRYLFWLQSKPQARNGDASWFSPRDEKIGQIVDTLLQGEDVNVEDEIAQIQGNNDGSGDDDETMEDIEGHGQLSDHHRGGSGGAGPGATGGDIREEGEQSRDGGADGGRA